MSKLQIETDVYNERRYGKPWIAKATFDENGKADFNFGNWIGETGYEGILNIDLKEGDIVARGQKDTRKPANSAPTFYIFKNGELSEEISKKDAYKYSQSSTSKDDLLNERKALIARIAEIDEELKDS